MARNLSAYFARVTSADSTWQSSFARDDFGGPLAWTFAHQEGELATLEVTLPYSSAGGWLAPAAKQWVWFALDDGTTAGPVPVFFGRVIGVPTQGKGGDVTLTYRARPIDYEAQRTALFETLKEAPYWDPVWVAEEDLDDPNAALFTRSAFWHVDPATHVVTISDFVAGEAGTIVLTANNMLWDDYQLRVVRAPLRSVDVEATVQWDQTAQGDVDISSRLPVIKTYSEAGPEGGEKGGIRGAWPRAGDDIGNIWSFGETSYSAVVSDLTWFWFQGISAWFPLWHIRPRIAAHYDVKRTRYETITFSMGADTQDVEADAGDGDVETITLSTTGVEREVDPPTTAEPNGAKPIGSLKQRRFFQRARGVQAFKWLLARARVAHLWAARCVEIDVGTADVMAAARDWTLRHDMTVPDPRLPDATATGKIVAREISCDGVEWKAYATVGVCPGNGGTVADVAGTNDYVEPGYIEPGYHQLSGHTETPFGTDVSWEDYSGAPIDDDGLDFISGITASQAFVSASVTNPASTQVNVLRGGNTGDPIGTAQGVTLLRSNYNSLSAARDALREAYSQLCIELFEAQREPFRTTIAVTVSDLKVRKGIDLEAV